MKATISLAIFLSVSLCTYATNYVVIGAFAKENNAIKLKQRVQNSQYFLNKDKELYYVFVLRTDDHENALTEAKRLQNQSEFKDAWVFFDGQAEVKKEVLKEEKKEKKEETAMVQQKEPAPAIVEQQPVTSTTPETSTTPVSTTPAPLPNGAKDFYFLVIKDDGSKVDGAEITVFNPTNMRKEYVVNGNEDVTMKPVVNTDDIRIECDLAGYRKIVQTVSFKDPSTTDGIKIENDRVTVPFHLVRLRKGDISILYNVFFYKDASIMRPESKFDLDGVLAMMNENPTYKIRIHGHTNGNAAGKLFEPGTSGDFFSMTGAKEGNGSAKKLSQKRADAIKAYLAKQGVDPNRMQTKAWGGKKPIYDKLAAQAYANVRVEVEVIEE